MKPCLVKSLPTLALATLLATSLAACSSKMSKSECMSVDYYDAGYREAKSGSEAKRLKQLTDACAKHGLTADASRYEYGRKVGLTEYCSDSRAESDAKSGKRSAVCVNEKVPPYEKAYLAAVEAVKQKKASELSDVQKKQSSLQKNEAELKGEINQMDQQTSGVGK